MLITSYNYKQVQYQYVISFKLNFLLLFTDKLNRYIIFTIGVQVMKPSPEPTSHVATPDLVYPEPTHVVVPDKTFHGKELVKLIKPPLRF